MLKQRTRDEIEFDSAFDERGQLRDGVTRIRVPMKLMDSASKGGRSLPEVDVAAVDAAIQQALDLEARDEARRRRHVAYDTYDQTIGEQWKNPPTGAGSRGPRGAQAGDVCTIDGAPGHLRVVDGELKCVADKKPNDAADHASIMDSLYYDYDTDLRDQWRRAK